MNVAVSFLRLASHAFGQTEPNQYLKIGPSGPDHIALTYPVAASREYISGSISARVDINRDGKVRRILLTGVWSFAREVRAALLKADFGSGCRGVKTTVWFSFVLDRRLPLDSPVKVQRLSKAEYLIVSPTDMTGSIDVDPVMFSERAGLRPACGDGLEDFGFGESPKRPVNSSLSVEPIEAKFRHECRLPPPAPTME